MLRAALVLGLAAAASAAAAQEGTQDQSYHAVTFRLGFIYR